MTIEIFGLIFDIFLFGILITIYDKFKTNKDSITKNLEIIEDFRNWKDEEASYRIMGSIRRLYKLKKFDINLNNCYFENIIFSTIDSNENFDFYNSTIDGALFKKCKFYNVNFNNIQHNYILDDNYTTFDNSIFYNCNFDNTFKQYRFFNCKFSNIDFKNSVFDKSFFKHCEFKNCKYDNKLNNIVFFHFFDK